MILAPTSLQFDLIRGGKAGRLNAPATFQTGIIGRHVAICDRIGSYTVDCELLPDGTLHVYPDTQWDFGSGPAIDTPAVVIASLAHDMICHLTNARLIPWACRAQGDAMYRTMLQQNGAGFLRRWWQYAGVRGYSEAVARWRDRHDAAM